MFAKTDLPTLELTALMYREKNKLIDMTSVIRGLNEDTKKLLKESSVLINNSEFRGQEAGDETVQAAVAALTPMDVDTESESEDDFQLSKGPESKTVDMAPAHKQEASPYSKKPRNYVDECNAYFFDKSNSRIQTLFNLLRAGATMGWVRIVASKVESLDPYDASKFPLLGLGHPDRHIHVCGQTGCDFIRALSNKNVQTFSWSVSDENVLNFIVFRKKIKSLLSQSATFDDIVVFTILLCSIGLPNFSLYTPETFIKNWQSYRFKNISNANVIKTICRDMFTPEFEPSNRETAELLQEYDARWKDFSIEEAKTADTYMFRHWYSYPTPEALKLIVDRANAIKNKCS